MEQFDGINACFRYGFSKLFSMFYRISVCLLFAVALMRAERIAPVALKDYDITTKINDQASVQSTINDLKGKWQGFINGQGSKRDQLIKLAQSQQTTPDATVAPPVTATVVTTAVSPTVSTTSTVVSPQPLKTNNIITGAKNVVSGQTNVVEGDKNKIVGKDLDVTGNENTLKGMNSTVIGNKN